MFTETEKKTRRRRIWIWWALTASVAAWLLWMTQRPQATVTSELMVLTEPAAARGISSHLLISILGNIVVFMPLGAAAAVALAHTLPGHRRDWVHAFLGGGLVGVGLSGLIELLQLASPSRFADIRDLGLNALGAFAGAAIGAFLLHRLSGARSKGG